MWRAILISVFLLCGCSKVSDYDRVVAVSEQMLAEGKPHVRAYGWYEGKEFMWLETHGYIIDPVHGNPDTDKEYEKYRVDKLYWHYV